MVLIGAIALIVIGPEKLPRVARTIGTLLGKMQRYVADVKQEVSRSMELDELKKMKETMESAARDVHSSVQTHASDFEKSWGQTHGDIMGNNSSSGAADAAAAPFDSSPFDIHPEYLHPKKKWRLRRGAMPQWYKARSGVRTRAQSGAARVARFRPGRQA